MTIDLEHYRESAERFAEELSREYYLHLGGHKPELEIEPIYDRHAGLFERPAVERLRELVAEPVDPDERRRRRYLLHFAFDGMLGQETKAEAEELARLEASLEVEVDGTAVPYRAVPIAQGNEPDGQRRAALEEARDALLGERLNPLHRASLERSHALCRELGWASYAEACGDLRALDLEALAGQAEAFLVATDKRYAGVADPQLERAGLPPLGKLRRSDLPRFFRGVGLDDAFPAERLIGSFTETLAGLGIDLEGQENVHLDTESRPTKSSRAFCSTPRVPDEVYLVIAPHGGRDDYAALFHEGGHTEHYANTDAALPFEFRELGDNSVTESFAFLIEHLTEEPLWLAERLGVHDSGEVVAQARASRLVLIRRYAAKLAYELELHSRRPDLAALPARYARLLGGATRVAWNETAWLADVDGSFYVACYLQAWALETRWRRALRDRFGERWFAKREAGEWLRELWGEGQRLAARELLAERVGGELDLADIATDLLS